VYLQLTFLAITSTIATSATTAIAGTTAGNGPELSSPSLALLERIPDGDGDNGIEYGEGVGIEFRKQPSYSRTLPQSQQQPAMSSSSSSIRSAVDSIKARLMKISTNDNGGVAGYSDERSRRGMMFWQQQQRQRRMALNNDDDATDDVIMRYYYEDNHPDVVGKVAGDRIVVRYRRKMRRQQQLIRGANMPSMLRRADGVLQGGTKPATTASSAIPDDVRGDSNYTSTTTDEWRRQQKNYGSCPASSTATNTTTTADDDSLTRISTTLVVQTSIERFWILQETCGRRWRTDPIIVVVSMPYYDDYSTTAASTMQESKPPEKHSPHHYRLNAELATWKVQCPHLTVMEYELSEEETTNPSLYPINRLRNAGLERVRTSHILVVDVDFVPSSSLDDEIRSVLLSRQLQQRQQQQQRPPGGEVNNWINRGHAPTALVIPAFERALVPQSSPQRQRELLLGANIGGGSTAGPFLPSTLSELRDCYMTRHCNVFDGRLNAEGHGSTESESWLMRSRLDGAGDDGVIPTVDNGTLSTKRGNVQYIPCIQSQKERYEPYMVLEWCGTKNDWQNVATSNSDVDTVVAASRDDRATFPPPPPHPKAPFYDERFVGYGKNKIQYFSHLRYMGYRFAVISPGANAFLIHNPHSISKSKTQWRGSKQLKGSMNHL